MGTSKRVTPALMLPLVRIAASTCDFDGTTGMSRQLTLHGMNAADRHRLDHTERVTSIMFGFHVDSV